MVPFPQYRLPAAACFSLSNIWENSFPILHKLTWKWPIEKSVERRLTIGVCAIITLPVRPSVRPSVRSQLLKLAVIHVPVSDSFVNYCILNVSISSRPGNYQTPFFIDEALLRSKLWRHETGSASWNERNPLTKFCVHIDINRIQPKRMPNTHI